MTDLTDFVRARLDEDEATVYAAGDPPDGVTAWLTFANPDGQLRYTTVAHGDTPDGPWFADGHEVTPSRPPLVIHDPARALREVAAKRAIVNEYAESRKLLDNRETYDLVRAAVGALRVCVMRLAAVYEVHPDYRDEWQP